MNEANNRTVKSFTDIFEGFQTMHKSFIDSINGVRDSLSAKLNDIQDNSTTKFDEVDRRLDILFDDCEKHFGAVRSESFEAMKRMKENTQEMLSDFEKFTFKEAKMRKKNWDEIVTKLDKFRDFIMEECALQNKQQKKIHADIKREVIQNIDENLGPFKSDLNVLSKIIPGVDDAESRLDQVETAMGDALTKFRLECAKTENTINKSSHHLKEIEASFRKGFDFVERRLRKLEERGSEDKDRVFQERIHRMGREFDARSQKRIDNSVTELNRMKAALAMLSGPDRSSEEQANEVPNEDIQEESDAENVVVEEAAESVSREREEEEENSAGIEEEVGEEEETIDASTAELETEASDEEEIEEESAKDEEEEEEDVCEAHEEEEDIDTAGYQKSAQTLMLERLDQNLDSAAQFSLNPNDFVVALE